MEWEPRSHVPMLAAFALLAAVIAFVLPWWTVTGQAGGFGGETHASPFDPDGAGAEEGAVIAVGILGLVGLLGALGGLLLWLRASDQGREDRDHAGWLWLGSGGFLLVAPLTAVITWPSGDTGFWGSAGSESFGYSAGAGIGWYLTIVAGAAIAGAGIAWLLEQDELGGERALE